MYSYGYPFQQQPQTDIGQVNSEQEAINAYVAAGTSRIMFSADDKSVYVKCVSMNGQTTMDVFDRREKQGQTAASDYVTRQELTDAINSLKGAKKPVKEASAE